uniref:Uncharacterized protein n=1 Tax=Vitis vinifera TaxID=29760 RepID=F6H8T1_VITVI
MVIIRILLRMLFGHCC